MNGNKRKMNGNERKIEGNERKMNGNFYLVMLWDVLSVVFTKVFMFMYVICQQILTTSLNMF